MIKFCEFHPTNKVIQGKRHFESEIRFESSKKLENNSKAPLNPRHFQSIINRLKLTTWFTTIQKCNPTSIFQWKNSRFGGGRGNEIQRGLLRWHFFFIEKVKSRWLRKKTSFFVTQVETSQIEIFIWVSSYRLERAIWQCVLNWDWRFEGKKRSTFHFSHWSSDNMRRNGWF